MQNLEFMKMFGNVMTAPDNIPQEEKLIDNPAVGNISRKIIHFYFFISMFFRIFYKEKDLLHFWDNDKNQLPKI